MRCARPKTALVAAIEGGFPAVINARKIIAYSSSIIRRRTLEEWTRWLEPVSQSIMASFANGIINDRAAVQEASTSPSANGQSEGQMYGRGKLALLQARVIGAG